MFDTISFDHPSSNTIFFSSACSLLRCRLASNHRPLPATIPCEFDLPVLAQAPQEFFIVHFIRGHLGSPFSWNGSTSRHITLYRNEIIDRYHYRFKYSYLSTNATMLAQSDFRTVAQNLQVKEVHGRWMPSFKTACEYQMRGLNHKPSKFPSSLV